MGENVFSLDFMGQDIILPKEDVVFKKDLGLVHAYGYYGIGNSFVSIPLVAIVDKNYFPVLSLTPRQIVPKIEMLDNGDILCIIIVNSEYIGSRRFVYHYYLNEEGKEWTSELDADAYEIVGDHTIRLCALLGKGYMYGLYDLTSKDSTCYFDKIEAFRENPEFGCKTALATTFVYDNDQIVNSISCEISEDCKVVSGYKEANTGALFDGDMLIDDVIAQAQNLGR